MANYNVSLCKNAWGSAACFLFLAGSAAAPSIQQISGTLNHKATVTISGSGFGAKAKPAPAVWDDASGANILDKWNGAWPSCAGNGQYNTAYRTPAQVGRNIPLPHSHITRYISGAHTPGTGADCGYDVMFWKNRTVSYPSYSYISWYQRSDDRWRFGLSGTPDDNYKTFDFSQGNEPYNSANWYIEYNSRPTSPTSIPHWHINDNGSSINGYTWFPAAINPMSGVWTKIEQEIKYTNQNDGYIKLWENGALKINYSGRTDAMPETARSEGVGGYARSMSQNNWRYFADVYLDYSRARVVLTNNADYSRATIIEPQVPSSWSSGSINVTVNLGKFSSGQTAYLFIFDPSGQRNVTGFPVTAGGTVGGGQLSPPANLRIIN